jgi:hexokinase
MDPLDVDFDDCIKQFIGQMEAGLAGEDSSLEMIPTFIEVDNTVPTNTPMIVGDAGGTNFRVASVSFDAQNKPVIEDLQKFTMPGVEKEHNRQDFFAAMAEYFRSVASLAKQIGFCFSYPVEMLPSKDGKLIRFSKEIKAGEVIGTMIGENLIEAMGAAGMQKPEKVIILNDTVATLLAGIEYDGRAYDSYIGFILGTGTNCSYVESNGNILKRSDLDTNRSQIINAETGGMTLSYRGDVDREFDATTVNPGDYAFEKMVSGAYLGPLTFVAIGKACAAGLISQSAAEAIAKIDDVGTRVINDFLHYPYGGNDDNYLANACQNGTDEDVQIVYWIADRLVERAAKLSAINLSAAAIKSGKGKSPAKPICIVADGTTFHCMKSLKSRTEFYLKQYLEEQYGVYTDVISVDNAPVIGAAIAGLTN